MSPKPFAHVTAAIATPFSPDDLRIDFKRLHAHARWLLDEGCDGLVLFGTTGEAASLTSAERKDILRRLIADGIPAQSILVGTGCCAVADTVELTRDAAASGCAGALLLPPYFFKGVTDAGTVHYFDTVISECGADGAPIYLYHIPQTTGVAVGPNVVAQLVARHGALIRGYKDSSGQWSNTADILARFPQLDVYVGSEALLLDNLRAGGAGCISATVNVQPSGVRRAYDGWQGNDAEELQKHATSVRKAIEGTGQMIPAVKALLREIHRTESWASPRPPLLPFGEDARVALRSELRRLGAAGF